MPPTKKTTAKKTTAKKTTAKKTTARTSAAKKATGRFTDEERAAMKARAAEVRAEKEGTQDDPDQVVLAKIAEMVPSDRALAKGIHQLVRSAAPELTPRLWYGMPAYARDGKVVAFFQAAAKFKARYATFGFNDAAALDDGAMWPTAFAVTELTPAVAKQITALVHQAAG